MLDANTKPTKVNPRKCQNCTMSISAWGKNGAYRKPCEGKPCLEKQQDFEFYESAPVTKNLINYATGRKSRKV